MAKATNRQVSLDSRRIDLSREIRIRVPQFDNFVTEYSGNISTTGMFIVSDKPPPTGTKLNFEFSVADDWKLIRGTAQVIWVRTRAEGKDRPAGMGIRFVDIDAQSRRLIRWMVEKHIREGGKPFELDELRSVIDEALVDVLDVDEEVADSSAALAPPIVPAGRRLPPEPGEKTGRQLAPLILTSLAVIGAVLALFWLTEFLSGRSSDEVAAAVEEGSVTVDGATGSTEQPSQNEADDAGVDSADRNAEPTTGTDAASQATAAGSDATELEAAAREGAAPIGSSYAAVVALVDSWAEAWSAQNVDSYLSFYSSDFRPSGSLSRAQWAAQRRERVAAPRFVSVAVSGLQTERIDLDHVRATFFQTYRSDRFSDSVQKTLELVWEDGSWKIRRELS